MQGNGDEHNVSEPWNSALEETSQTQYRCRVCVCVHVQGSQQAMLVKLESQLLEDRALKPKRSFGDKL